MFNLEVYMDILNRVGKWYLIREVVRKIFKSKEVQSSSYGESTFNSKAPMKNDAYNNDKADRKN